MQHPVELFKLLADETRSTIVMLLRESGEMCVCDICAATEEPQPKISRHMALLREARLVIDRREGKWVYYRLSPHMPAWACAVIDSAWNCEREKIRSKLSHCESTSCQR